MPDVELHKLLDEDCMNSEMPDTDLNFRLRRSCARVALSRWVNEPPPVWQDILSAHDVARLTRRPNWILCALALVGRFPRKCQYRGRQIGWLRSDVLAWMNRELTIRASAPRVIARSYHRLERSSRQHRLPLNCTLRQSAACAGSPDRQTAVNAVGTSERSRAKSTAHHSV